MRSCRLRDAIQQRCCTAIGAEAMYRDTTLPSSYVLHTLLRFYFHLLLRSRTGPSLGLHLMHLFLLRS